MTWKSAIRMYLQITAPV